MKQRYFNSQQIIILSILWITTIATYAQPQFPKKIILFIGDGMGTAQVEAARMYQGKTLSFDHMTYKGYVSTHSHNKKITDSAASATAMATGRKTNYQTLGMDEKLKPLTTVLEYHQSTGKSTGLISTTYISHATPASFASHQPKRDRYTEIAQDILHTKPNVLMGGSKHLKPYMAIQAGYHVVTTKEEFRKTIQLNHNPYHAVLWPTDDHMPFESDYINTPYPYAHLSDMTIKAIELLNQDPDGFFLMVEAGRIDHAGHQNHIKKTIYETIEFSHAVTKALQWAETQNDVLILVTADHETGSLLVNKDQGKNKLPIVTWGTRGHSFLPVPIYGYGAQAQVIQNKLLDNIDICHMMVPSPPLNPSTDDHNHPIISISQWALAGGNTFVPSPASQRIPLQIHPETAVDHREITPIGEKIHWSKDFRGTVKVTQTNTIPEITQAIQIYGQPEPPKKLSITAYPYAGRTSKLSTKHTLGATDYIWTITPKEAYQSIQSLSNQATVQWSNHYYGDILVEVQAINPWQEQPQKTERKSFVRQNYPLHKKNE
ncbi:alkaline phosphatase [Prolixibacteraceae bacterium]|nr:alkaline phosphatase [Prolixibacteraceae bacterium]